MLVLLCSDRQPYLDNILKNRNVLIVSVLLRSREDLSGHYNYKYNSLGLGKRKYNQFDRNDGPFLAITSSRPARPEDITRLRMMAPWPKGQT